jgi:hypothetical protein
MSVEGLPVGLMIKGSVCHVSRTAQETFCLSITKTNLLVVYREITVLFSDSHTRQVQSVAEGGIYNVKSGGIYSNHSVLRD